MRSFIVAASLSIVSIGSAFGAPYIIQPIAPDTHSYVTVTLGGAWPDGCVPAGTQTSIVGDQITILVQQSVTPAACAPITTAWRQTVNLGLMQPGTYTIHAFIQGALNRVDLGIQQFTVRPADPFRVFPPGAPVSGGTRVRLESTNVWPSTDVVFGDAPAVTATQEGTVLTVIAPPHAAGTVDVKVGLQSATRAFTYYDPSEPPDPSIFEKLLFPIAFTGPGAFGSSWVTENRIYAPGSGQPSFFENVDLDASDPAGVVVHPGRGTMESAVVSSRIRDLSHQAQSIGTEIPVVHESDWRLGIVRLTNVPAAPNVRAMLRIWGDHNRPVSVSVEVSVDQRSFFTSVEIGLTRQPNGLLYAQIDLGSLLARLPGGDPRDITVKYLNFDPDVRLWMLATITNNDTQQVTAIWPQ